MKEYHKINSIYKRDTNGKFVIGEERPEKHRKKYITSQAHISQSPDITVAVKHLAQITSISLPRTS